MKKETVIMILEALDANYRQRMSEKEMALQIRNWHTILNDLTDEQGLIGLRKILESSGEFMPPVGKFKRMCLSDPGCQSLDDDALTAWSLVVQNLNCYTSPIFKDTAISETIRKMGGWERLCGMLIAETPFRQKDFTALYPICRRQKEEFPPMLRGRDALFVNGELVRDYKFIGFSSSDDKGKILASIKSVEANQNKLMMMIGNARQKKSEDICQRTIKA